MDFSEYETASEFAEEFESDHEPPKDQLFLKKMVHKAEHLRIYKRIAKIGKSYLEMPAKFDQVILRIRKLRDNSLETNLLSEIQKDTFDTKLLASFSHLESLASTGSDAFTSESLEDSETQLAREQKLNELVTEHDNVRVLQLGKDLRGDDIVLTVSNMKKGELSYFEVEKVGYDSKTKERKLFGTQHYLIELIDFVTIIDVFGNEEAFKVQLDKGQGIRRVSRADQVNLKLTLKDSTGGTLWDFQNENEGRRVQ